MALTVLMNAGPWLPVPPVGYGGIENIVAWLVPELRRRGVRVVLCTVGSSSLEADEVLWLFPDGKFPALAAPYRDAMGVAQAHMQFVIRELRARPDIDLVHDHLEVVGASLLSLLGNDAPPVLQTLHWNLQKHPEFYNTFDGKGRVFFNAVSKAHMETAPPMLRAQILDHVDLAVDVDSFHLQPQKGNYYLTLSRFTEDKGVEMAARICKELGVPLRMAGPVAGLLDPQQLEVELSRPDSPYHSRIDVRYYMDRVRGYEDGERIVWVGTVHGVAKQTLLGGAKALLAPIRWDEPGGTAAIEALACGTPVIAMRRGAMTSIVEHGVNGFLCDDETEFARYMSRAGDIDPSECRRIAEERFSVPVMTEGYLKLYQRVLDAPGNAIH